MKKLRPRWKALIGWTCFVYVLLLGVILKYHMTRDLQERIWSDAFPSGSGDAVSGGPKPSEPDASVKQVPAEELAQLIHTAAEEWARESPERREAALHSRIGEFRGMNPEAVEGVVDFLTQGTGVAIPEPKKVGIETLDLESAVPFHMRAGPDADGNEGMRIELQDAQGQVSEVWVSEEDISPEERQALQAYSLMNQVPGLDKLRPLLIPLYRKSLQP